MRRGRSSQQPPGAARLEVVADGLPRWQGAQLAIDTTVVSPVCRDGTARPRAADGEALKEAPRRKERTYPEEFAGEGGRARLVVLGAEVGGRWSAETAQLLSVLAKAQAHAGRLLGEGDGATSWRVAQLALSPLPCLLEIRPAPATGDMPSVSEVLRDARFA